MSTIEGLRKGFNQLADEWKEMDPQVRFLDVAAVGSIIIFGIGYILVSALNITLTVSNGAMLIFPLILAGYIFVFRSKVADPDTNNQDAKKEFLILVGITIGLILLTFIYSIFINAVI